MITANRRVCVGKNLANMELQIFAATIFRRYTFVLESPKKHVSPNRPSRLFLAHHALCTQFDTFEGFIRKPVSCRVGMKRREL